MARTFDSLWPLTFQNPGLGKIPRWDGGGYFIFQKMAQGPGTHLGPWDPFGGARRPRRPKADIMEAEGRLNGGLGADPPGIKKV